MFSDLPQLNSLRVFDSAARLTSFKAAALELNVTPTAVSHQIRNLEEKLGTLLFERKTRVVVLTPEGEKLAQVTYSLFKNYPMSLKKYQITQKYLLSAQHHLLRPNGWYLSSSYIAVATPV